MKEWTIHTEESQERLDKYLRRLFPQAAGGFLYRMLRKKNITLNGKKAKGNERLKEGDVVRAYFSEETYEKFSGMGRWEGQYDALQKLPFELRVLFEDEELLFCDKPAGWLSQKAEDKDISLNEHLRAYLIQERGYEKEAFGMFRPSVMNRLDRGTSGIVAAAKTLSGARKLSGWIKGHELTKEYLCLVHGDFSKEGTMVSHLIKDRDKNISRLAGEEEADASRVETVYERLEGDGGATLVKARLVTGKSHQIRVQLAGVGCPIVLDPKYGDRDGDRGLRKSLSYPGQLLHALRLILPDGREINAPVPEAFWEAKKLLKRNL